MDLKEFFMQVRLSGLRLASLASRMEWLRGIGEKVSSSWSGVCVQGDPSFSKVEASAVALADMQQAATDSFNECKEMQQKALDMINSLKDERYRSVLDLRYISCNTWPCVAALMNYEETWVMKLHAEALKELEKSGY